MNSSEPRTNLNKNTIMTASSKFLYYLCVGLEVNDFTAQPHPLPAKDILTTLPPELHLHIFSYLDQCASCCLGLTCKIFHSIHKHTYKWTSLLSRTKLGEERESAYLFHLLQEFVGDRFSAKRRKEKEEMIEILKTFEKMPKVWGKALSALDDCSMTRYWSLFWLLFFCFRTYMAWTEDK